MTLEKLISLLGLFVFIAIAYALSEKRSVIKWRLVAWGVGLQFVFAVLILKTAPGRLVFDAAKTVMTKILDFTIIGSEFIFGKLATDFSYGAAIAFRVLPTIIFVASLMGVLYYYGIIQRIVKAMAWVMERTMKASGAEAFMAAALVFMGIETITAVKEYIRQMTRSELFTLMTCFMATIAGSVMAAYTSFGAEAGHLLAASVMSAPAAIVLAKIMVPETEEALTLHGNAANSDDKVELKSDAVNVIEAAANGAVDGLKLAATIGAILLAFVALIGMVNFLFGYANTSLEEIAGYFFAPFAFIMGVPWADCMEVGRLLATKVVFNEFLAYMQLPGLIETGSLQPRSVVISTYALCSFANFGSLAILIGGIGGIAPERKKEVAAMGLKALAAGCMAGFMTATIAGVLI